jgi:CRP/FNR family transcriptional regulator
MTASVLRTVSAFFEQYSTISYAKGQIFLLAGEKSDYIYYLIKGLVKVYTISYRGDEIVLHVYKPPDFFPVAHAITQANNEYIYEADSEIIVRRAPVHQVKKLLEAHPSVALDLLRRSYDYMNGVLKRQSLLMAGSAKSRLMHELIVQCEYFDTPETGDRYELHISEKELASRTGLSRETVNREIKKLKKENLITLTYRRVIVLDINNLEQKFKRSF